MLFWQWAPHPDRPCPRDNGHRAVHCPLVTLLDLTTTNNTISIIAAGPIAKDISDQFGVSRVRTASILDLFSSVGNGVCPWAGQILAAAGLASISTLSIVPFCWYSILMFVSGILFILTGWPKGIASTRENASAEKTIR